MNQIDGKLVEVEARNTEKQVEPEMSSAQDQSMQMIQTGATNISLIEDIGGKDIPSL